MGPATTEPSDVTTYLTAGMAQMRQTAVRSLISGSSALSGGHF